MTKNPQVTIITPIAPHHEHLFPRCRASVEKQTVSVRHLHMVDTDRRGPGYIRNRLTEQVKTEYIVYLDADDYLEPTFIEECLYAIEPHAYAYTNWYEGTTEKATPSGAFWDTAWHLITCLIHTDMMRIIGGFNETLDAMEDTELFLKFDSYAYCGVKIDKALVHYTNDGRRSKDARANGLIDDIKKDFSRRYKVACCGQGEKIIDRPAVGKKAPNDVQVMALWQGNQVTGGAVTGRRYPKASRPMKLWVDPRDAKARPDLYRVIEEVKKKVVSPTIRTETVSAKKAVQLPRGGFNSFADMLLAAGIIELPEEAPLPTPLTEIKPDFVKLNEIAKRIYNV